jgi:predicted MPP superfamily phosphohydrolase
MSYRYIIVFSIIILLCVFLDIYTWRGLQKTVSRKLFRFFKWFIPVTTFLFFLGFILTIYRAGQGIYNAHYLINLITGFTFGVFLAKLLIAAPFLIEDVFRYPVFVLNKIKKIKGNKPAMPSRRRFVRNISLSIAAIPLSGAIYAITRGKYNYQVKELTLEFDDLPKAFDGFKIVQFSDFHAGSFDDNVQVKRGLELINEAEPDLIVFTGDLVNNRPQEAEPFVEMLSDLKAPYGKYSILGNHDYGDYMPFANEEERAINREQLESIHMQCGFDLLNNEKRTIRKESAEISLLGVENWGNAPFPQYGDLDTVTEDLNDKNFSILLSHDPDHWEDIAKDYPHKFHLTLSGHTHGAQFGVDIPGWQWSPVKYRYKRWLGLYQFNKQYLFVSKGFGFLGFPGRIGMSPEVVVFTLKRRS